MGIISLEKANHLYWLGRYTERVFTTLTLAFKSYDQMLDGYVEVFHDYCNKLNIDIQADTEREAIRRFLYDKELNTSVCSSINGAYDNGIVLRDEIGSESLSFIQMALDSMKQSKAYAERTLQLKRVQDLLYAFWGCIDDEVEDEQNRNLIKTGRYVERMDLYIRLEVEPQKLEKEFAKLANRLKKIPCPYNGEKFVNLGILLDDKDHIKENKIEILECINGLLSI